MEGLDPSQEIPLSDGRITDGVVGAEIDRHNLFDSIVERQPRNVQSWLERKWNSNRESGIAKIQQMIEWTRSEHAYTVANRSQFR